MGEPDSASPERQSKAVLPSYPPALPVGKRVIASGEAAELLARIGRTPVRRIAVSVAGVPRCLSLKIEAANPGGSIKDRTACSLIDSLETRGVLTELDEAAPVCEAGGLR
jgi:hypothetical protein